MNTRTQLVCTRARAHVMLRRGLRAVCGPALTLSCRVLLVPACSQHVALTKSGGGSGVAAAWGVVVDMLPQKGKRLPCARVKVTKVIDHLATLKLGPHPRASLADELLRSEGQTFMVVWQVSSTLPPFSVCPLSPPPCALPCASPCAPNPVPPFLCFPCPSVCPITF